MKGKLRLMANKTAKTSKVLKKKVETKGKAVRRTVKPVVIPKKVVVKPASKTKAAKPVVHKKNAKGSPVKAVVKKTESLPVKKSPLDQKSLVQLKEALIKMRDRLTGQITSQSDDSLKDGYDTSS